MYRPEAPQNAAYFFNVLVSWGRETGLHQYRGGGVHRAPRE